MTRVEITIEGKIFKGDYNLTGKHPNEFITVYLDNDGSHKGTQLGNLQPDTLAKTLLRELVTDYLRREKAKINKETSL